jgi:hypothetical protein
MALYRDFLALSCAFPLLAYILRLSLAIWPLQVSLSWARMFHRDRFSRASSCFSLTEDGLSKGK